MPRQSKTKIAGEFFTWNLFLRDGVWYADGRHNTPSVGKHSLGTRDRETALRTVNELDHRKAVENRGAPERPSRAGDKLLSIEQGWERYMAHVARRGVLGGTTLRTQKRYRAVRDKHKEFCSTQNIVSWNVIDKRAVADYGTYLARQGLSDATVYLEGTLLKQIVKWLIEEEKVLPETNCIRLQLKRSEETDRYCYTREQVQAVIAVCRSTPDLRWLGDVIVALATTGMRIGELVELRWSDVDLNAGVITLSDNRHSGLAKRVGATRTTKGRRSRRLPIDQRLREVLVGLPHRQQGGPSSVRSVAGGSMLTRF